MDFGLGLLGYNRCWDDAAFAEEHGFATAGFVDSPLLGGETFSCMARAAASTTSIRLGTFLAVPSNRSAATAAQGVATINRMAPGRTFMGLGTGYTSRTTFGLPRLPPRAMREYAQQCRGLLDGEEVTHREGQAEHPIRMLQVDDRYIDRERIPIYLAGDGPMALKAIGRAADGWIMTLMFSNAMEDAHEVFERSWTEVREAAAAAGRNLDDAYTIVSLTLCVLDPGESPTDERVLERVGAYAMMPFHSWADNPGIEEHLPPPVRERLPIYKREVLDRFGVGRERLHQHTHNSHLSRLQEGEAKVLTDEIVRMTTFAGTADELVDRLRKLEAAGMRNFSIWVPPHHTREAVVEVNSKLMPRLARTAA
jgi:5,10-methylenetetrahydromethanopterin reductase